MVTILVTGSNGQLGSELLNLSRGYSGYEFIFTDLAELDITSRDEVARYIDDRKPSWVVNCAGYTGVDAAENDPSAAYAVNANGPANLAAALRNTNCRLVHISTDYVFDGLSNKPYLETDKPSPQTVYGKSKSEGETAALTHPATIILRTSWLYGVYGKNFVRTILGMLDRGIEPRVVFDQVGSPTWARGLAESIMAIISGVIRNKTPFVPGIYNYTDEGVCSWFDLAAETAATALRTVSVHAVRTESISQIAPRPPYSVLDKQKIKDTYGLNIRHWRENLVVCIKILTDAT